MNLRGLGILLLKLWGLASLVWGAFGVVNTAILKYTPSGADNERMVHYAFMTTGLSAVLMLGLGAALLLGAHRIVAWIEPDTDGDHEGLTGTYSVAEIQSALFGGVGVFIALGAVRDIAALVYAIARHTAWDDQGSVAFVLQTNQQELAGVSIQLIAAILLIVNRTALAMLWSRMRPMASARDRFDE